MFQGWRREKRKWQSAGRHVTSIGKRVRSRALLEADTVPPPLWTLRLFFFFIFDFLLMTIFKTCHAFHSPFRVCTVGSSICCRQLEPPKNKLHIFFFYLGGEEGIILKKLCWRYPSTSFHTDGYMGLYRTRRHFNIYDRKC